MVNRTIQDSSLFETASMPSSIYRDSYIRMGMVRSQVAPTLSNGTRYIVDVRDSGREYPINCSILTRFGGPFNYEEWSDLVWDRGNNKNSVGDYKFRAGDTVIVAFINGQHSDGVIIGCIKHPARKQKIANNRSIAYISEFNGIETLINKDGEFRQTFKGVPTNLSKLSGTCLGVKIPEPTYDDSIGSSYYSWSKDGSYTISDNAKTKPQLIKIDKPNGKIVITSGNTMLTIDKKEESYTIVNKKTTVTASDQLAITTKKTTINSGELFNLEASDIKTKGKIAQTGDMKIDGNITQAGNLKTSGNIENNGTTKLSGGAFPLIYDILLIIGTGNIGAPVVSSAITLKTTMTKAT